MSEAEPSARLIPAATGARQPSLPGFEILEELGRDGLGVVYKARQKGLNRLVAVKVIPAAALAGPREVERFRAEVEAVAQLQHPHIVQVHDVGEHEGNLFVSVEYVGGGRLDRQLNGVPQPPRQAAELIETLARAIQVTHEHGIVHGDLKPSRVLLTSTGQPKITARAQQIALAGGPAQQTDSKTLPSSPSYLAPEQAAGRLPHLGPLVDVYALGAILYEMLTGRPPFKGADRQETLELVCHQQPAPPSHLQPQCPPELETICLTCLRKDPRQRYRSALALADELHRFLTQDANRSADAGQSSQRRTSAQRTSVLAAHRRLGPLQQALRAVQPAAILVAPRVLERVIRQASNLPGWRWQVPHRHTYVVDRHILFRHVEQDELDLGNDPRLPSRVLLIARPSPEELDGLSQETLLLTCWRRLFHATIHLSLEQRGEELLSAEAVRARVEQIGSAQFEEIRQVLTQDQYLLPDADERSVYIEFAAVYLELRYFAPELLPGCFPGLRDLDGIEQLLARDVDAQALFNQTRMAGAPEPGARTDRALADSHEDYRKLVQAAARAAGRGNCVKAAILRTRAVRLAPAALAPGTRAAATADLQRLVIRMRQALQLSEAEAEQWLKELPALLDKADQGRWPVEAALLNDLQNACLDQERELYALGLVEAVLSGGRRPIQRPLPSQRFVRTVRHLRSAAQRVPRVRLADSSRSHLDALLAAALRQAEERLRERFRPILSDALLDVGLAPTNPPEQVAFDKVLDELLDRISSYGFLTFGDLRDAISRSQLKLPDLATPGQFLRGDELRRLDRRLTVLLDGVYRPSEFYVRWLEGLGALNFGTRAGRLLTGYVTLPFGGAFVLVEAVGLALHHLAGVSVPVAAQVMGTLVVGLFLLGLLHVERLRHLCVRAGRQALHLARVLLIDIPSRVLQVTALRRLLWSWPVQLLGWCVLQPALICLLLWWLWPEVFGTLIGSIGAFVAAVFLLNSRLGRIAVEAVSQALLQLGEMLRGGLLVGLYRLIVRAFKHVLDVVEYLLVCVDEWLRYRRGDGWLSLTVRTLLGVLWYPVSYLARFYVVVLIEPAINPLKFPVCSVASKFNAPMLAYSTTYLTQQLATLGPVLAYGLGILLAFATVGLLPNAFGFLFWEMKENWRLYRANRRRALGAVAVGGHGETIVQLLRRGFHSGTVPYLYARLRRAERKAHATGNWQPVRTFRHRLEEIESEVRLFVSREMVALLQQAHSWQGCSLAVGHILLSPNRIGVELTRADFPDRPVRLEFEERGRWLMSSMAAAGWLKDLPPEQWTVFANALAGLYKLAGVELVSEQLRANLPPGTTEYTLQPGRLVVWLDRPAGQGLRYDLGEGLRRLEPRHLDGRPFKEGPVLDADQLVFGRLPLLWQQWVESWRKEQEGTEGLPLFDCAAAATAGCR